MKHLQNITRFGVNVSVLFSLLIVPLVAHALETGKIHTIGFLTLLPTPSAPSPPLFVDPPITEAFFAALHRSGYAEGENLVIERRYADGKVDRLAALAAELVALKPALVVVETTAATIAAHKATRTVPLIFSIGSDPVELGFVTNFAQPDGNLTGYYWNPEMATGDFVAKKLQILKEAVPGLTRVACVCPAEPVGCQCPDPAFRHKVSVLGLDIQNFVVQGPEDFDRFFNAAREAGTGAVLIPEPGWFYGYVKQLAESAARNQMPAIFGTPFADLGGLLSYGVAHGEVGARLAAYVERILKGAVPADLPVEQPTRFELVINLKAAKAMDLKIPTSVLFQADRIIE
jgi:putative ABC transport system substrate-binding protein